MKQSRVIYYDLLRILACFLVIVNHTVKDAFVGYPLDLSGILCTGYLMLSKIAVPLFLMLSGALLLKKDYTYKQIFISKIMRTLIAIAIFSIYAFLVFEHRPIRPLGWISSMIQEPAFVAYWYLYALLGIYLMLPFLRILAKNMEKHHFHYLFVIGFVLYGTLTFFVDLGIFPQYSTLVTAQLFTSEIIYLFLGYYLTTFPIKISKRTLWIIFIGSLLFAQAFTIGEYVFAQEFKFLLDRHFVFTSILMSVSLFILFQQSESYFNHSFFNLSWVSILADSTFGIYLIHGIMMGHLASFQQYMYGSMNRLLACLINEIIIFMSCFIIVRLLVCLPKMSFVLNSQKRIHEFKIEKKTS